VVFLSNSMINVLRLFLRLYELKEFIINLPLDTIQNMPFKSFEPWPIRPTKSAATANGTKQEHTLQTLYHMSLVTHIKAQRLSMMDPIICKLSVFKTTFTDITWPRMLLTDLTKLKQE
jgi:hypothetical protein